jgi:GNAT superfamily N-acetyltransferase
MSRAELRVELEWAGCVIVPMTEHDLLEVVEIEETTGLSQWGWEAYRAELEKHEAVMLVARRNYTDALTGRSLSGYIAARINADELHVNNIGVWPESRRRGVGGALLWAALEAGARRFIQESFALTYPDSGDRWIDETIPTRPARYNRSTADAEASAQRLTSAGGVGVALRFALLYGPGDPFTRDLFRYVRRGWLPIFGRADGYVSMVTQEDAAAAVVAALEIPAGIYNVVEDEPLTRRELATALAELVDVKPPRIPPAWLAPLGGAIGTTIARSLRISNRKLKSASAWSPRHASSRASWRATYASDANRQPAGR